MLEINPEDAAARGIRDGDTVWLKTQRSKIKIVVRVTQDIAVGVVHAPSGGGNPAQNSGWMDFNVNDVVDDQLRDPISGYVVNKALRCTVERVLT